MNGTAAQGGGGERVLVTGATGFVAQHCILQLLEAGYVVRGTVRAAGRAEEIAGALAAYLSPPARRRLDDFDVVAADLTVDAGWDAAVAGCRYVLHVASPLPRRPPRHADEVVQPARDGTLRVLRAAAAAGVARVVVTSSISAVIYGHDRQRVFDERDWSNVHGRRIGAYDISKTLAERAAWEYVAGLPHGAMELVAINPGLVLGPLLTRHWPTSGELVKKLLDRDVPAVPDIGVAPVDVRDVAAAHVAALTEPRAAGERFICATGSRSVRDIALILATGLAGRGFDVPTGKLPAVLLRVVSVWDRTARLALNDLGVAQHVDSTKIRDVLGWSPRRLDETVLAMAESMIALGVVTPQR